MSDLPGQRAVYITTDLITAMLQTGNENHFEVVDGLPQDARLIRIVPDYSLAFEVLPPRLCLIYESAEWPAAKEGDRIPDLEILFRRLNCERPERNQDAKDTGR